MHKRRRSSEVNEEENVDQENEKCRIKRCLGMKNFISIMYPHVIPLMDLCLRPEDEKEINSLLEEFWDKFNSYFLQNNDESIDDIFCKFALASIYQQICAADSVISRILYAYVRRTKSCSELDLTDLEDRNCIKIKDEDSFVTSVESFTLNMKTWDDRVLSDIMFMILQNGQLGFLHFIIKYDFVLFFPVKNYQMIRYLTRTLLNWRTNKLNEAAENGRIRLATTSVITAKDMDKMLTQIRLTEKKKYRRILMILCLISIIKEHQIAKKVKLKIAEERCHCKLECLNLFIKTTSEPFIAFKEIENCLVTFFGESHNWVILQTLKTSLKELAPDTTAYRKPRTLKDLTRSKIRDVLKHSGVLPEKVAKLPFPRTLKSFLLFHKTNIWDILKTDTMFANLQRHVKVLMQIRNDL